MSTPAKRTARWLKWLVFLGIAGAGVAAWLVFAPPSLDDGGTVVPAPDAEMRAATVAGLAKATAAQGVCYGWHLSSSTSQTTQGSSLGADVPVDSDPSRCAKWVEVRVYVDWTSSSSEASDNADVSILSSGVAAPPVSQLNQFGLTEGVFIDQPDRAICQAALALPLLLAERGAVPPVPAPAPGATAQPLAAAGSDFWRDRWAYVVGGTVLVVLAILIIGVGWFERRHERTRVRRTRTGKPPRPVPPPRAAPPPLSDPAPPPAAASK
ncbi:hypothetical protein GCM10022251_63100 [Phytohabitans flavus]|uniref:Uncharacterized protein n=1 Tax=Phytohabitans flavus TaxID=1076124 RepID=A0A6F8XUT8_9ACTN|nr:hypothetical protein [Phytohabitans flavus]BCB77593.1 hypothetical protein Pflav_040030 [Phytohabitans flavus]